MRLTSEQLAEITHLTRKASQVKWFKEMMGVDVPFDRFGVILTDATYEKLLEKRLGLNVSANDAKANIPIKRPAHMR